MRSKIENDAQLIEAWLKNYKRDTARSYRPDILKFAEYIDGDLKSVETEDVSYYIKHAHCASDAVRRRKLLAIKSMYRFGIDEGYFKADPAATLRNVIREPDRPPPATYSEAEIQALLRAAKHDREYLMIGLAYYVALSSHEIAALTWADLLPTKNIRITIEPYQRVVPVPHRFWKHLMDYPEVKHGPIFPSRNGGGFVSARQVNRTVQEIGDRAGIENANISTIRNSHAQHAFAHGARIQDVQLMMRHRTPRTTVHHQLPDRR